MSTFQRAVASLPGQERIARHPHGGAIFIHATAAETDGAFGIWETFSAPGTGPTRHTHLRETEIFRVIAGTHRFWCGPDEFDAPAGSTIVLPPGIPHRWQNVSDGEGRMMGIVTPGGFEGFFMELERAGARDVEQILAIQERYGVIEG